MFRGTKSALKEPKQDTPKNKTFKPQGRFFSKVKSIHIICTAPTAYYSLGLPPLLKCFYF